MRVKPEYYRRHARRSRDLAARIADEEVKAHLLSVARQYDQLADETEKVEQGKPRPGEERR